MSDGGDWITGKAGDRGERKGREAGILFMLTKKGKYYSCFDFFTSILSCI
jgi:hypothetical protein